MRIKLHGIFAKDFGPEYVIEADTIAEAIEGFTRQIGFYSNRVFKERPTCRVAEINDAKKLYEKTELKEINLVPAMIGGGGVGKILVGAALIAFAISNPFGWAMAAGSLASIAMTGILTVGATLVMQGAMQLFMKAPQLNNRGSKDPDASKYFGLSENSVQIGTPIAIQFGRGPATGQLLAINIDAKDLVYGQFPTNPT